MTTTISLDIDYDTEKKLREIAFQIYGFTENAIGKAIVDAIKEWIEKNRNVWEKDIKT